MSSPRTITTAILEATRINIDKECLPIQSSTSMKWPKFDASTYLENIGNKKSVDCHIIKILYLELQAYTNRI